MDIDEIQQRLCKVLQERNRIFPQRDEQNDHEVNAALTEFVAQVNAMQKRDFTPDAVLLHRVEAVFDAPLFLCGSMKSGTTLLLELLDGHSEMVTLPGDSFFWGKLWKEDPPLPDELQAEWDRWLKRMLNPTGQEPFQVFGEDVQPYVAFRQYLQFCYDQLPDAWRSIVISVLLSYYCANPVRALEPKVWIEKTPGNEEKIDELVGNFPNARFIHIVRDPRENMASLKKLYATRGWQWDPIGMADTLGRSCRLAGENQQRFGRERYHVLNYEALTEEPAKRMAEVANYIGVKWENSLLKPTINGIPAHANSMYKDRQIKGMIRKATNDKWRSVLTNSEKRAVVGIAHDAKKVGYEWQNTMSDTILLTLEKGWAKAKRSLPVFK